MKYFILPADICHIFKPVHVVPDIPVAQENKFQYFTVVKVLILLRDWELTATTQQYLYKRSIRKIVS